jgi:hypothetical protein
MAPLARKRLRVVLFMEMILCSILRAGVVLLVRGALGSRGPNLNCSWSLRRYPQGRRGAASAAGGKGRQPAEFIWR